MPDLLIELFSEEIPARMQRRAADDLKRLMTNGLVEAGLTYASAGAFVTPRRLALSVDGLPAESPTTKETRRGPRVDAPETAVEGFLRGAGLTRDDLRRQEDKKGEVWVADVVTPGRPAAAIVAEVLENTVRNFPWPKSMRWGTGSLRWVRPLRRIVCVMSDEAGVEIVPVAIDDLTAGDVTEGHRFMAPAAFSVSNFDDYAAKLRRAHVVLSSEDRAESIRHDLSNAAFARGLEVVEDEGLLAEVAGLVEWPVVLVGEIADRFRGLPPEVLRTSMREHQKFFALRPPAGADTGAGAPHAAPITHFATVANRETDDDGATSLEGNARVLAARLSDAAFFWDNDLAVATGDLTPWHDALAAMTFHEKLGTVADKVARVAALARELAPTVGADADAAETAARLAKTDLASEMVGEFPELQGVMGRYYAEAAGHPAETAAAVAAHYRPLGPSDAVPTAPVSIAVALADKLDTLTAFWAIDETPTGSKDPYALRRAALGVIRIVLENGLRMGVDAPSPVTVGQLRELGRPVVTAPARTDDAATLRAGELDIAGRVAAFLHDRLKVWLRDRGVRHDVIDACLAMPNADDLTLLVRRAEALQDTLATEDGANLIQGFRRADNILTQAETADGVEYSFGPDRKFAETDAEVALFDALDAAEAEIAPAMAEEDFRRAMAALAGLRAPIDAFFEAVQVNAEPQMVRRNRLNLLHRIRAACLAVADLRRLEG